MHAVRFDISVLRYLLAKSVGRVSDSFLFGSASGVSLTKQPEIALPGPHWVRLEMVLAGICGSDIANLCFQASPAMEPFGSFPAVIGHEIVARVVELGSAVRGLEIGQRVAVDPMISCAVRGWERPDWCGSCEAGLWSTCEKAGEAGPQQINGSGIAPGLTIGYHRSLPGGWSEGMLAHSSQVHPVQDGLSDRTAVLIEPLSVAVHAVLNRPPREHEPVLVIGSGPIALATVWALRGLGFRGEIVAQTKRRHEADLALALGASSIVTPGDGSRSALLATGARAYKPIIGEEVYAGGGFPLVFDCVGSEDSIAQALRYASPRGRIVLLGCAAQLRRLDLTFLWARELDVKGCIGYGTEMFRGRPVHTFEVTQQLLKETGAPVDRMITHSFPLSQYRQALQAAAHRKASGSIKVLLAPRT